MWLNAKGEPSKFGQVPERPDLVSAKPEPPPPKKNDL